MSLAWAITFSRETSGYQRFKLELLSLIPVSKDAFHVYLGCACLLLAALVLRRPLSSWSALLPGLVLSLAMEVFDLRDARRTTGEWRWHASLHDLVNTNLLPVVLVFVFRRGWIRAGARSRGR